MKITTPLQMEKIKILAAGDEVLVTGTVYLARDAAHQRLVELIKKNKPLPFDPKGQIIFYAGPSPAKPGSAIGAIGPTSSYRMDDYTIPLLKKGLKGIIGKGDRALFIYQAMKKFKAVYFVAIGGVAALLSKKVMSSCVIAYEDLGAEAIRRIEVKDFPVIVAQDIQGRNILQRS
jgi:fumarate hydratase subunit beta